MKELSTAPGPPIVPHCPEMGSSRITPGQTVSRAALPALFTFRRHGKSPQNRRRPIHRPPHINAGKLPALQKPLLSATLLLTI